AGVNRCSRREKSAPRRAARVACHLPTRDRRPSAARDRWTPIRSSTSSASRTSRGTWPGGAGSRRNCADRRRSSASSPSASARQHGSSQLQRRVQVAIMIESGEVRRGGERMPLGGPERVERRRREACHQTIPYVAANTEGRRLRCLGGQPIGGTAVAGQYVRV